MTIEQDLILAAISLDRSKDEQVLELIEEAPNWPSFFELASRHGVLPLSCDRVIGLGGTRLDRQVAEQLEQSLRMNVQNNLRLIWKLIECVELLSAAHVECVVLKGPAFALQEFGDLNRRKFTDLDILIHETDFPKAYDLLVKSGYAPHITLEDRQKKYQLWSGNHFSFIKQGDIFEMHWGIAPQENTHPLTPEQWWQEVRSVKVFDKEINVLSEENTIIFTCLHGAKHGWRQLKWVVDLAYLCRTIPEHRWMSILEQARRKGFFRQVCLGCWLAANLAGASFPSCVNELIKTDSQAHRLAIKVASNIFKPGTLPSPVEDYKFYLKTRERWQDRLHYLLGLFFVPKLPDWRAISLPENLYFLYYIIRPMRLIFTLGKDGWEGMN